MWIASKHGFYSIVLKDDGLHVRARNRGDLVNLCAAARFPFNQIMATPCGDYTYRLILKRPRHAKEIERMWAALANSIDYPNFKEAVGQRADQRGRLQVYAEFWATMAFDAFAEPNKRTKRKKDNECYSEKQMMATSW